MTILFNIGSYDIFLIMFLIPFSIALGLVPYFIGRHRNHDNLTTVTLMGMLGLLVFPPVWIAALVWALAGSTTQDRLNKI